MWAHCLQFFLLVYEARHCLHFVLLMKRRGVVYIFSSSLKSVALFVFSFAVYIPCCILSVVNEQVKRSISSPCS
jgi:hypothetical protein